LAGEVPFSELASSLGDLVSDVPVIIDAPTGYDVPGALPVAESSFLQRWSLERAAREIYTDSPRVHDEAGVLGVPCHALGGAVEPAGCGLDRRGRIGDGVTVWDRQAGLRAADVLVANFARVRLVR
jgi:hypothetical protein